MNYTQVKHGKTVFRIYNTSEEAWFALTRITHKAGWRIGSYGQYENCLCRQ